MINQQIKEILHYSSDTGKITWLISPKHTTIKVGDRAGCFNKTTGYRSIRVNGKLYQEHRLAWLLHYGYLPAKDIDHRNGIKTDNRIDNLREATDAENQQNRGKRKDNSSGYTGVSFHKPTGKWLSQIAKNGKKYNLGYYDTPELAHEAYLKAKAELHTFQPEPRA